MNNTSYKHTIYSKPEKWNQAKQKAVQETGLKISKVVNILLDKWLENKTTITDQDIENAIKNDGRTKDE